ncbi:MULTISPECIES: FMN-dependent NADH-azoreductase [Cryobacterium]|uniref:FMN dependent NADH:quinone oxidoreductase n=1 Tax=Cryobacterium levicorallinum TaxID=995038 RepID=A0A1I3C0T4_9MICO|nr:MULTISPECIES: NAD(P)H-dependent oxidoreductase [Cryobacterium]TFB85705.1 FMN-dependent NADH-azoreductase [Cryobacterium levicorallinum]TFD65848.1 FMN-dependent NADH-azoreductase [Cryobacterium sp. Hh38]GEP27289.1 FMN-dependent NADH-azoreductase [Cryobacterium levicorallinum]SFH68092.1 FMN-dependent NADH-azoreductase [Cryobacterium levicorallinum]
MPILLQLDSSADLVTSRSRAITATFADTWRSLGADHTVVHRDLHREPLPHLTDAALHFPPRLRPVDANPSAEQEALQQVLISELVAADVLLIGVPLYNYSMPSTLKAWIDYIHLPAVTAPFDDPASQQPLAGRPAVLVSTRGGVYDAGTSTEYDDHALPALSLILADALGMTLETIVATRTLSERFGAPADEVAKQHQELAAAHASAAQAARRLG